MSPMTQIPAFWRASARYHGFQVCAVDDDGNELIRAPSRLAMMLPSERRVACSSRWRRLTKIVLMPITMAAATD